MTRTIIQHLFLTGFMGSGKSTIGRNLAKRLNVAFVDTDQRIEKSLGVEIKDIFREKGEDWFRTYEGDILGKITRTESASVISLGGGTLMIPESVKIVLESGTLIYIKSSPAEIWKRIRHSTRRPLMRNDGEKWTREKYLERIT
ncbi:MAG: shikimate kinase, partial [Calditrichales bacterium]